MNNQKGNTDIMQQADAAIVTEGTEPDTCALDEVRAKRFVLEDDDGNVRAEIKMIPGAANSNGGPAIYLYDLGREKPAVAITSRGDNWSVVLDLDGRDAVAVTSVRGNGGEIQVCDSGGAIHAWKPNAPVPVIAVERGNEQRNGEN